MKNSIFLFILLLSSSFIFSQEKDEEKLKTEEITVVKSYQPTVKEADKLNTIPKIDSVEIAKKDLIYSINSIPVASTFTPEKGKAKTLRKASKEQIYGNYVSASYGNYNTPKVEAFLHSNSSKYNNFGGFLDFHSSGGGIKNLELDDNFLNLNVDLFYKQNERYFDWQATGGAKYLSNNWYGLTDEINFNSNVIKSIDEKQAYTEIYLGGDIEFFDALIHTGKVNFNGFTDKHKSKEINGSINGVVDFPIGQELIYTEISFEFLNGMFDQNFLQTNNIEYTYFNIGLSPNIEILRDNLSINVGAKFYYSITTAENQKSKFYLYPNVTASYKIADESLIAYAGVVGDLQQNSYRKYVNDNSFVSPTLNLERTSQQYDAYLGFKGLLNSNINFNIKAAYGVENDKPLYKLNPSITDGTIEVMKGYEAGNSFQVVYDDVTTIHAEAELIFDFDQNFKFGGNIEFNSYNLSFEKEAWNLPMLKSTLIARYDRKKWSAGADFFFASDRKDELSIIPLSTTTTITNSTYFDVNFQGQYNFNDKLSIFADFNNILNNNYQKYTYYKVQGFQFLIGMKFKFDF